MSDSRSRLLKLKAERDLEVSAVRVAGDERESQRRTKEEEERQVSKTAAAALCCIIIDSLLTAIICKDSCHYSRNQEMMTAFRQCLQTNHGYT